MCSSGVRETEQAKWHPTCKSLCPVWKRLPSWWGCCLPAFIFLQFLFLQHQGRISLQGLPPPSLELYHFLCDGFNFYYFIFLIYDDSTSIHHHYSQARLSSKSSSWGGSWERPCQPQPSCLCNHLERVKGPRGHDLVAKRGGVGHLGKVTLPCPTPTSPLAFTFGSSMQWKECVEHPNT